MSEGFFERNLRRLLAAARPPAGPSQEFKESLRGAMQAEAARIRRAAAPEAPPAPPGPRVSRGAPWAVAAAAMIVVTLGGLGLHALAGSAESPRSPVTAGPVRAAEARISADRPVVLGIPPGSTGRGQIVRGAEEIARVELTDGAELELRPGRTTLLALKAGLVRVEAAQDLRLLAAHVQLAVPRGSDVHVAIIREGDRSMFKTWIIPGGVGAAAGAALVAILTHRGDVEVRSPESRPALAPVEKSLVLQVPATRPVREDDRDRLAQAEKKIAELEKKLAAAKKDSEILATELVQKKGVTIESIAARLADLKKGGSMSVFLPGKTAGLIADLKALGPAGTQALLDLLKSENAEERIIAAKLLEDLKDPAAIPNLREAALNDSDEMAAKMAGHALALMEDPRALEPLREVLAKKRSWESEVNALWGLVNLGDQDGLQQAIAYMDDKKVSDKARASLGANIAVFMRTADVMPIVDATVRDFWQSEHVMGIAIGYYQQLGTPAARDRLQAIADDARVQNSLREDARKALQQ